MYMAALGKRHQLENEINKYIDKPGVRADMHHTLSKLWMFSMDIADDLLKSREKAKKWDALGNRIASYYPDEEGKQETGDLCDIGEAAAIAFGFL